MLRPINKKGFEMSFAWMFALIAGAFILGIAIFAASKIISSGESKSDVIIAKEIQNIMNPLETSFQEGVVTSFELSSDTRIYNFCASEGEFGKQILKVSQKTFDQWSDSSPEVSSSSRYIFSESPIEGRKFILFSKPLRMPFKVADLIYMIPADENYCFKGAIDDDIEEELFEQLRIENVFMESDCPDNSINICFTSSSDCDIIMGDDYVLKGDERLVFVDDTTMYAAIFSDPTVYECQMKRLAKRLNKLSQIYQKKVVYVDSRGCVSGIQPELAILSGLSESYENSADLERILDVSEEIAEKTGRASCKLW